MAFALLAIAAPAAAAQTRPRGAPRCGDLRHQQHGADHRPARSAPARPPGRLRPPRQATSSTTAAGGPRIRAARRRVLLLRPRRHDVRALAPRSTSIASSDDELHDIAETIRRRFLQQSVLTFDHLHRRRPRRRRDRARGPARDRAGAARRPARRPGRPGAAVRRLGDARRAPAARRRPSPTPTSRARSPSGSAATSSAPSRATASASSSRRPPPAAPGSRSARS